MKDVGNGAASRAFADCSLPARPTRDSTVAQKQEYVRYKYTAVVPKYSAVPKSVDAHAPAPLVPVQHNGNPRLAAKDHVAIKPATQARKLQEPPPEDLISFDCAPVKAVSSKHDEFFAQFGL